VHVNAPAAFSAQVLDETNMTSGLGNVSWQIDDANRVTGFYARQYYKKPNRFLGSSALYTSESNSNEDDVFDIVQGLWNSVITNKLFMDARVSFNRIFFPLYYNGHQALRPLDRYSLRNERRAVFTARLQTSATTTTTRPGFGRHEFRVRFDRMMVNTEAPLMTSPSPTSDQSRQVTSTTRRCSRRQPGRDRALRSGHLYREEPDAHRRPALGATGRVPAGAEQSAESVVPHHPEELR
jgi:hypothetical protein